MGNLLVIEGVLLPNACGKGIVVAGKDETILGVGVNVFPLYNSLGGFGFDSRGKHRGSVTERWRETDECVEKNVNSQYKELGDLVKRCSQIGDPYQGQFGSSRQFLRRERSYTGQTIPEFLDDLFRSGKSLSENDLLSGGEKGFGMHVGIFERVIKKYSQDPGRVMKEDHCSDLHVSGGFFYATPVLQDKTVLNLFGRSKGYGSVKDLNDLNAQLANQYGFITPAQYAQEAHS